MPQTWDALKRVMWARFVPSYYARDMLNKLQQLRQGTKSVEEYYQELQMGMLRYNINREIQDILAYKDYANITRLFDLACKAERKCRDGMLVQGLMFLQENLHHGSSARLRP
jgi:hypothetical protein